MMTRVYRYAMPTDSFPRLGEQVEGVYWRSSRTPSESCTV